MASMDLVIPDLISPSYFPAIAAVELGCLARRGYDFRVALRFPVTDAVSALRDGAFDVMAGAAHVVFHRAPDAGGVRLLAALSRHTYWFLVVRADLGVPPNAPLSALRGLRIGAAPGPDDALLQLLADAGVDRADLEVMPVPGSAGAGVSFGVTAANALAAGALDGFWANGMGAQVAVDAGIGTVVLDARRGDGPPHARTFTFPALLSTERAIAARPEMVGAVVAGLVEAQTRLREDPGLARQVASRHFPPMESNLAPVLIARDAPYYQPAIGEEQFRGMVDFARARGSTDREWQLDDLVPASCRSLWGGAQPG